MNKNKGFTLLELLIVIAIIALLTVVTLVFLSGARDKSRDARRFSDLRQLRNALDLYAADHNGNYPAIHGASTASGDWDDSFKDALFPYLKKLPKDPGKNDINQKYYYYYGPQAAWTMGSTCIAGSNVVAIASFKQDGQPFIKSRPNECDYVGNAATYVLSK